jgi:hypothetical protein
VTHTFRLWLWYRLYEVEWIRRYTPLRTPPDRWTLEERQAFRQWHLDCIERNLRIFPGPRTESASPYDPRWPLNAHDEQVLLALKRQKEDFRARGYTWVRGWYEPDDQAWLALWREWGERSRERSRRYTWVRS